VSFWIRLEPKFTTHGKWAVLSDAAFRFGHKLIDYCCTNETAFIHDQVAYELAGTPHRARKLAAELERCGAHLDPPREGILERVDGGWRVHNFERYAPPAWRVKQTSPELSAVRAAAGSKGGKQTASKRQFAAPPPEQNDQQPQQQNRANGEAKSAANAPSPPAPPLQTEDGNGISEDENSKTLQVVAREHAQVFSSSPDPDSGIVILQSIFRQKGERPLAAKPLLGVKLNARDVDVPDVFREYAAELGLGAKEFDDVLTDWRARCSPSTSDHLANLLNRFVEQAVEKRRGRRGPIGAHRQPDSGYDPFAAAESVSEDVTRVPTGS
jgi:hypothetical protein